MTTTQIARLAIEREDLQASLWCWYQNGHDKTMRYRLAQARIRSINATLATVAR